jgi:hypothetical protein
MATLSPLEHPTVTKAADAQQRYRFVFWFSPGPPIAPHQKIVTYLILTDDAARIFSARQRHLLLFIGGADAPSRRQLWALRELSRRVARLDMGGGLDS